MQVQNVLIVWLENTQTLLAVLGVCHVHQVFLAISMHPQIAKVVHQELIMMFQKTPCACHVRQIFSVMD
jgi:hypothetical protein